MEGREEKETDINPWIPRLVKDLTRIKDMEEGTEEVEKEINELVSSEDSEIEEQYEITDSLTENSPLEKNDNNLESDKLE